VERGNENMGVRMLILLAPAGVQGAENTHINLLFAG